MSPGTRKGTEMNSACWAKLQACWTPGRQWWVEAPLLGTNGAKSSLQDGHHNQVYRFTLWHELWVKGCRKPQDSFANRNQGSATHPQILGRYEAWMLSYELLLNMEPLESWSEIQETGWGVSSEEQRAKGKKWYLVQSRRANRDLKSMETEC